ncbi:hypothetical protein PoHVEF18_009669 [Penicillium ochrochloron]
MVPGFNGIPLDVRASLDTTFAGASSSHWLPSPMTAREIEMLRLMNDLTDHPLWDRLVFDESTLQTWQKEAMARFPLISLKAWDWCVAELRDKVHQFQETGLVMVLNASSGVCKSDSSIPQTLTTEIQRIVTRAMEERVDEIEWQPNTDQQVWSLLDPSLYPLITQRTRVLIEGGTVPLEQTLDAYGQGQVARPPERAQATSADANQFSETYQWLPCELTFCGPSGSTDVRITSYVNNLHPCRDLPFYKVLENVLSRAIDPWNQVLVRFSNLSLQDSSALYDGRTPMRIRTFGVEWDNRYPQWAEDLPTTLEVDRSAYKYQQALALVKEYLTLPEYGLKVNWWFNKTRDLPTDWETTLPLREVVNIKYSRMFQFRHSEPGTAYSFDDWKAGRTAKTIVHRENYNEADRDSDVWFQRPKILDPRVHNELMRSRSEVDHHFQTVRLEDEFRQKGLQVIVKLSGIEINPANPSFSGDQWHLDGLSNEHIVAGAVYCFDSQNVTDVRVSFAQRIHVNGNEYAFDHEYWDVPYLEKLFNIKDDAPSIQQVGSVSLRQGRLIAFPNCLHQRWEPFELIDKAQPGHFRFLTMWLVDPYFRICSTRNVPPQRLDWWEQESRLRLQSVHPLPQELADLITKEAGVDLMDLREASNHRCKHAEEITSGHEAEQQELARDYICFSKQF